MTTAYVIIRIEAVGDDRVVRGIGIYGEPWETLTLSHHRNTTYATVTQQQGKDYGEARERCMEALRLYEGTRWMVQWIEMECEGAS